MHLTPEPTLEASCNQTWIWIKSPIHRKDMKKMSVLLFFKNSDDISEKKSMVCLFHWNQGPVHQAPNQNDRRLAVLLGRGAKYHWDDLGWRWPQIHPGHSLNHPRWTDGKMCPETWLLKPLVFWCWTRLLEILWVDFHWSIFGSRFFNMGNCDNLSPDGIDEDYG